MIQKKGQTTKTIVILILVIAFIIICVTVFMNIKTKMLG